MKEYFLHTARLGFSVWSEKDRSDALALWGNPEVTKFITADGKMSDKQVQERLNKEIDTYKNANIQYFPIYSLKTNQNAGCCGLRPYDSEKNILEMGIHLKEQYWGQGLAQEACSAVIEYAFHTLGVNALFAGHNPQNTASARLLKRLGFIYTHDEFYPPTGLNHPSYLMTRQDYRVKYPEAPTIKIGIIGDYDGRVSHLATDSALQQAAVRLGLDIDITWLPTEALLSEPDKVLQGYDGLWCSPGSPYKSMSGALTGICYARENHIPFMGTCGGFQHAVLEFGRDVLNRKEIQEEGFDPYQPNDFITPLSCSLVGQSRNVLLPPESYMAKIYGGLEVIEKFNCSFGLSSEFSKKLEEHGFAAQGMDEEGNPRILVLNNQPFYVITLFQPQLSSSPEQPHPLILEYLKVCRQLLDHGNPVPGAV